MIKQPLLEDCEVSPDGLLFQSRRLRALPGIVHGVTTTEFSSRHSGRPAEMAALSRLLGMNGAKFTRGQQVHSNTVALAEEAHLAVDGDTGKVFPDTDALVCSTAGHGIVIFTADCVPVLLADAEAGVIALAHAGWRGTCSRIVEATIGKMILAGADAGRMRVWMGPCICGDSYEVSEELAEKFAAEFDDATSAGVEFLRGRLLDLVALNAFQAARLGVAPENISWSGICSLRAEDSCHSYRRNGGKAGRMISVLARIG